MRAVGISFAISLPVVDIAFNIDNISNLWRFYSRRRKIPPHVKSRILQESKLTSTMTAAVGLDTQKRNWMTVSTAHMVEKKWKLWLGNFSFLFCLDFIWKSLDQHLNPDRVMLIEFTPLWGRQDVGERIWLLFRTSQSIVETYDCRLQRIPWLYEQWWASCMPRQSATIVVRALPRALRSGHKSSDRPHTESDCDVARVLCCLKLSFVCPFEYR